MSQVSSGVEWRITVSETGSSEILVPNSGPLSIFSAAIKGLIVGLVLKFWIFLENAWNLGLNEPRKVIHCLKVGMALTLVSLFYYMRPLYDGVGGNAMWAIMTVVVVFENTVGATIGKSFNRVSGTFLAGSLAVGVHWITDQLDEKFEPYVVGVALFLLASATTFSRFIPTVKARFDYGALIFILTFSLVAVSGYRVDKLLEMAHHRVSTIMIGTSLCVLTSMLVCPIWAGEQLHLLISRNMDKLAKSLDGSISGYLSSKEDSDIKLLGYKCVLNSKATEDSMANFARWEPAHGVFNYKHPWKQYLKIGASMRNCAYCIEALNRCIHSENQVSDSMKQHFSDTYLKVSSNYSSVIRDLSVTVKTMRKSSNLPFLIKQMHSGVHELKNDLKSLPNILVPSARVDSDTREEHNIIAAISLVEAIPVVTLASLLIEIGSRVQGIVGAVEELACLAEFKCAIDDKASNKNAVELM